MPIRTKNAISNMHGYRAGQVLSGYTGNQKTKEKDAVGGGRGKLKQKKCSQVCEHEKFFYPTKKFPPKIRRRTKIAISSVAG